MIISSIFLVFSFIFISDCGIISPPDNGSISFTGGIQGNTSFNAIATYECDSGFTLTSSAQRICTRTSEWIPAAPNCTRGNVTFLLTLTFYILFYIYP